MNVQPKREPVNNTFSDVLAFFYPIISYRHVNLFPATFPLYRLNQLGNLKSDEQFMDMNQINVLSHNKFILEFGQKSVLK